MPLIAPRLWALLCLILVLQMVSAQSLPVARRQDELPEPTATRPRPESPTTAIADDKKPSETFASDDEAPETTSVASVRPTTLTKSTSTKTAFSAITSGDLAPNSTYFNSTIPEGQLPIRPKITPGWGVAGVIMILTGVAYTLIGIKNRWVHTFFSSAYAAALGIAVLIVYVMNTPVSIGVQGAYVAGAIVAGCIVGTAASFFKEITEGLGCALGGFCVSMWLLCLVPGGLLHTVTSKAIFISCFTVVAFVFYLSRLTRDWALMTMISFAGATVIVLGIDTFSRAGLKEFWAYVWDLNHNLFPLGANTYPVTKGVRVETAAIIIFCLIGVISQVKLWRVIREQKKKRAEERAEAQRNLDLEEENIGRRLEEENARERRRWELEYGDGDLGHSSVSRDSDMGDDGMSEKKMRSAQHGHSDEILPSEVIELDKMNVPGHTQPGPTTSLLAAPDGEGKITVRVAADVAPPYPPSDDEPMANKAEHGLGLAGYAMVSDPVQPEPLPVSKGPDVVPLPFRIPAEDETRTLSTRSSVATFADDVMDSNSIARQNSTTQRLSRRSKSLLRKLSKSSKRNTQDFSLVNGTSTEGLVARQHHDHDDNDKGSIAATIDGESVSTEHDDDRYSYAQAEKSTHKEAAAAAATTDAPAAIVAGEATVNEEAKEDNEESQSSTIAGKTTEVVKTNEAESSSQPRDTIEVKTLPGASDIVGNHAADGVLEVVQTAEVNNGPDSPKPRVSESSAPVSLTKERLPRPLSRVAKSFRTNEWAKHLSNADAPTLDELELADGPAEAPAPLDLADLQRTAFDGVPAPASTVKKRNPGVAGLPDTQPNHHGPLSRRGSLQQQQQQQQPPSPTESSIDGHIPALPGSPGSLQFRSASVPLHTSAVFAPIAEEQANGFENGYTAMPGNNDGRNPEMNPYLSRSSDELSQQPLQELPPVPGVMSYTSPQTLIGQREMFLRSKSQGNLYSTVQESQENTNRPTSELGSLYNYPMYAAALVTDPDDMPLSQRKNLMRQSSAMSLARSQSGQGPSVVDISEGAPFDSHQPKRTSAAGLTPAARQAQLASFRQSVAQDLRSGTPLLASARRETPFGSTTNLLSGSREAEVQRNIEMQRNMIMGQKEAEAQRREMQWREKEWADRVFDERMRSGDLLEAHREAMRKMQRKAKD